uniref:sulfatase-like hydrolase/transferase n=1 Tax=Altererythrobacter segetis TaxID=1104773 RepID=UPI00140C8CD5|nr:sulfatase-like hydrolase/transferase [Altererythrobacter segetis]
MTVPKGKPTVHRRKRFPWLALAGAALFACGFAVANRFQLTNGVLYRWAAHDVTHAVSNFALLAVQAAALLGAIVLLGRRLFTLAMALAFVSILVNLSYGQTTRAPIDIGTIAWMAAETRQAGNVAGEFATPLLLAGAQAAAAIALFVAARAVLLRRRMTTRSPRLASAWGLLVLLAPSLLAIPLGIPANAAERNVYSLGFELAEADPPPPRAAVELVPQVAGTPRHIVWLVDESVAYAEFERLIAPRLAPYHPVDFGMAASLANCSAPSNLALRSGVEVRRAGPRTDLRRTPSIWGYARKAGYRTMMIDGQTSGAPQNFLLPPERALIDEIDSAAGGIDTDVKIAGRLNRQLRSPERTFTYVVLRGVHFQYKDHFPAGMIPAGSPEIVQYRTALGFSKGRFFDRLLDGVDRSQVAVVYHSDHGQNLTPGKLPHCSADRAPAEYEIPLLAFLPDALRVRYATAPTSGHSASQVFPTLLEWMGYDSAAVQRRYDNDLTGEPARYVRFGRDAFPLKAGDSADVTASGKFPGA